MPLQAAAAVRGAHSSTMATARRRRTCAPPRHLADIARSSPLVRSARVIVNGLPIRCLHPANRSAGGIESEISEEGKPPRVGVNADWYYSVGYRNSSPDTERASLRSSASCIEAY